MLVRYLDTEDFAVNTRQSLVINLGKGTFKRLEDRPKIL